VGPPFGWGFIWVGPPHLPNARGVKRVGYGIHFLARYCKGGGVVADWDGFLLSGDDWERRNGELRMALPLDVRLERLRLELVELKRRLIELELDGKRRN